MFKKIHLLFVFAFALPAASYARGPFDNGDYSQFLDETGIYQVTMRFKNGSGFAQWGTNVAMADAAAAGGGGAGGGAGGGSAALTTAVKLGSPINRSVIYYKGIVFVGNATGEVDHARKFVLGITNGSSNVSTSSTASAPAATDGGTPAAVTASSTLVNNGAVNLTANTQYTATINQTAPILKFNGSGTLSVANPNLTDTLNLALQNLIAAIPGAVETPGAIEDISDAIDLILNNTWGPGGSNIPAVNNLQSSFLSSDTTPIFVFGSRIFQSSTR